MIEIFFTHLLISSLCLITGLLIHFSTEIKNRSIFLNKPIILHLINGLIGLTTVSQIVQLFHPLNLHFALILLVIYITIILIKRRTSVLILKLTINKLKKLNPLSIIGFIATWLLLLLINSGPTLMDDTESYHIQMVKWIHEYGTVPGIANLHERFGFNSSWFSSIAIFTLPSKHNFYSALNGIISIWLSYYLWSQVDLILKKDQCKQNLFPAYLSLVILLFGLFLWPLLRGNASTTNYDFITSAIIIIIFFELLKQANQIISNNLSFELILWPVYLCTVRIINYPLLILTVFSLYILLHQKKYKTLILSSVVTIIIIIPFLARNIVLSGYPFYPSPILNLFNVNWKVEQTVINDLLRFIKYFNRVNTMYQPIEETASISFPYWVFHWYKHLFDYDKVLTVSGIIGLIAWPILNGNHLLKSKLQLVYYITLICQLCSWFFIAPDPRFVYGCLLCGTSILFLSFFRWIDLAKMRNIGYLTISALIIFTLGLFVYKPITDSRYRNLLFPYMLPQPPLQRILLDNKEFYIPEKVLNNWNPRCYASELPCLYKIDPRLHLRGQTLKEGFSVN
jgi:hypothetical protein